jgi:hypothetical protein
MRALAVLAAFGCGPGGLGACVDNGERLANLGPVASLKLSVGGSSRGTFFGAGIIPKDINACPTLRVLSRASVDGLPLPRESQGGFAESKGGQSGSCNYPVFNRFGADVLVAMPIEDTVVVADDTATWTIVVSNMRTRRTMTLAAPADGRLAKGAPVQLQLAPGGDTLEAGTVDFVLDSHLNADGSFNEPDFSVKSIDGGVTFANDTFSFVSPGGPVGSGTLFVSALLSRKPSRCDGVATCIVAVQAELSVKVVMQ